VSFQYLSIAAGHRSGRDRSVNTAAGPNGPLCPAISRSAAAPISCARAAAFRA